MWLNDEEKGIGWKGEVLDEGWPRCFFANSYFLNILMGEKWWL